jgi:hypothetical protein
VYYICISGVNQDAITTPNKDLIIPLDYKPVVLQVTCIKTFELKYMGAVLSDKVKNPYVKLSISGVRQETKPIGKHTLEN